MQYLNGDLARLQVEQDDIKRKQQLGQTLQQAGLNPVQGGNSVLALLAALTSTIRGNSLMKDASKSMSENLASQFDAQNQADQAKADAEQKRRDEDWQRKLQEIDYGNKSAAQYRAPSNIDPNSPEGINARLQFEKGKAGLQPKAAGPATPAYQKQIEAAKAMGIDLSPEDLKQLVTGLKPEAVAKPPAVTAEARNKLALINNAIANAQEYQKRTVSGQDFNDMAANTNDTPQLIKSAIQDMLYAKSGASAPVEEVQKAEAMFGPSLLEKDSTAASKVGNLLQDLTRMRDEISGQQAAQGQPPSAAPPSGAQGQPTQTATNPQTGQRIGLINGQWVPI